jgi:chemotaxis signal transduction protein
MSTSQNANPNSFVVLRIGARRFALDAGIVAELAPPVRMHTFPHTSKSVAGVIVRRRRIVPVYDAGPLLAGRTSEGQKFYLIAQGGLGEDGDFGAILVNGECEMATGEMRPPEADRPAYVAGTVAIGDESLDVLNLEALVASASENSDASGREAGS